MDIHRLTPSEALKVLGTCQDGLTSAEASRRLKEYGFNELTEVRRVPLYRRFLAQFTHFLAVLLWLAAGLCFLSEYLHPGEGLASLGLAILVVICLNALFTFIQEYRAERAVRALRALIPFRAKVLREGGVLEIPAREVVPGDVFLIETGDKIPADGRLLKAHRLMVNNAPLTGESDPKSRVTEPFAGDYLDSPNLVFAGTLAVSGSGLAMAAATGMATEFGKIAHLTTAVEPGVTPLQQEIRRLAHIVAIIAMTLGTLFFCLGFVMGRGFWHNLLFAVGIIIANVPEGLLPTVTLSLAMGSQRLAKKKALIKGLNSVETLGAVTVICSDKTGTLTQNRMQVKRLWLPGEEPTDSPTVALEMLKRCARLCNNAIVTAEGYRGDPTEVALLQWAGAAEGSQGERLGEIPFDADRKRMTVVAKVAGENLVLTKGALENVLPLCTGAVVGDQIRPLDEDQRRRIEAAYHAMSDEGLRVMAFAFRKLVVGGSEEASLSNPSENWERHLIFMGLAGLEDPPRPEVPAALQRCRQAGIRVFMLTGDAGRTALAVARQVGLCGDNPLVLEGPVLEKLSDQELLRKLTSGEELIFARLTPNHKLRLVSLLKAGGEKIAVTGDGVNDAPALKQADIGIAMGVIGTDVAREAADMVLLDDNFATIVMAIEEGRAVFENIRKFMSYIFASNIPEIVPYIAYILLGIPLPLTVMQILAVDLGTDMLPALALGAEPPAPEIMQRPPRTSKERLLKDGLLARSYLFLGPMEAAAALFGFFYMLYLGGWHWGETLGPSDPLYLQATSACLTGIIVTQMANVFACRSFNVSVVSLGMFSNPLILVGLAWEILLALFIIYHPWGQVIFGTASLPLTLWALLTPFALGLLLAEEARKFIVRSK